MGILPTSIVPGKSRSSATEREVTQLLFPCQKVFKSFFTSIDLVSSLMRKTTEKNRGNIILVGLIKSSLIYLLTRLTFNSARFKTYL